MIVTKPPQYIACTFNGASNAANTAGITTYPLSMLCWLRIQHSGPAGFLVWLGTSGQSAQSTRIQVLTTGRCRLTRYTGAATSTDSPAAYRATRGSRWVLFHGVVASDVWGQAGTDGVSFSAVSTTARAFTFNSICIGSDLASTPGNYVDRTVYMCSPMVYNTTLNEIDIRRIYMGVDPRNVKGDYLCHWYPDLTPRGSGLVKDWGWAKKDLRSAGVSALIPMGGQGGFAIPPQLVHSTYKRQIFSTAPAASTRRRLILVT